MAAEKLTRGRLIQILVLMTVLITAFIWRTVTYSQLDQGGEVALNAKKCLLNDNVCTFNIKDQDVELQFINTTLSAQKTLSLQLSNINVKPMGIVSGVSMNMGSIPVMFHQTADKTWVGEFTVPACMHDSMTWGVEIKMGQTPLSAEFIISK